MPRQIRYCDYVQAVTVDQDKLSYSVLTSDPQVDKAGNEIPQKPEKLKMSNLDVYRLLQPYVSTRFMDQVNAVVPLAAYLALFQVLVLVEKKFLLQLQELNHRYTPASCLLHLKQLFDLHF